MKKSGKFILSFATLCCLGGWCWDCAFGQTLDSAAPTKVVSKNVQQSHQAPAKATSQQQ